MSKTTSNKVELTFEQEHAPKVLQAHDIYHSARGGGILDHCLGLVGGYPIWGQDKDAGIEWALVAAPYLPFADVVEQTPRGFKAEIIETPKAEMYGGGVRWIAYTLRKPTPEALALLSEALPFYAWPAIAIATLLPQDSRHVLAVRYGNGELWLELHTKQEHTAAGHRQRATLVRELMARQPEGA